MGIIIKHSRQTALLLSAFSALSIYSMEQDSKKPEPLLTSIFRDTITEGKSKEPSTQDRAKQKMAYYMKKCFTVCAGRPFYEQWHYKTNTQEVKDDEAKTSAALSLLDNNSSYRFLCVHDCLKQYNIRLSLDDGPLMLVRRCKEKLNDLEKNNS